MNCWEVEVKTGSIPDHRLAHLRDVTGRANLVMA